MIARTMVISCVLFQAALRCKVLRQRCERNHPKKGKYTSFYYGYKKSLVVRSLDSLIRMIEKIVASRNNPNPYTVGTTDRYAFWYIVQLCSISNI